MAAARGLVAPPAQQGPLSRSGRRSSSGWGADQVAQRGGRYGSAFRLTARRRWAQPTLTPECARDAAGSPSQVSVAEARRVLGVQPGATADEAKLAYFRLARQCHPDVTPADDPEDGADGPSAMRFTQVDCLSRPHIPPLPARTAGILAR